MKEFRCDYLANDANPSITDILLNQRPCRQRGPDPIQFLFPIHSTKKRTITILTTSITSLHVSEYHPISKALQAIVQFPVSQLPSPNNIHCLHQISQREINDCVRRNAFGGDRSVKCCSSPSNGIDDGAGDESSNITSVTIGDSGREEPGNSAGSTSLIGECSKTLGV